MTDDPARHEDLDDVLDGNAAAGQLGALFGADMTVVPGKCVHCGSMHMMAEMRAYVRAPGTVLRCPICDGVILRIVETDEATYVDARGMAYLRFEPR